MLAGFGSAVLVMGEHLKVAAQLRPDAEPFGHGNQVAFGERLTANRLLEAGFGSRDAIIRRFHACTAPV
jgi:hypothetical protein